MGEKESFSQKLLIEGENSLSPTYYFGITNDNGKDLEFGLFNVTIDIFEDSTEVK